MNITVPCQSSVRDKWRAHLNSPDPTQASIVAHQAMKYDTLKGHALSLSYGNFNDPLRILESGFQEVHNIDLSPQPSIDPAKISARYGSRFCHTRASIKSLNFSIAHYNAIVSNHGLAYRGQKDFEEFFALVKASVRTDGILATTLFGEKDEWLKNHQGFAMFRATEVLDLFDGFDIHWMREYRLDGHFTDGTPKRWHFFAVVAQKNSDDSL